MDAIPLSGYDKWSRGILYDLVTVAEAVYSHRRRKCHRLEILNDIDEDIRNLKDKLSDAVEDVSQWKRESGYKDVFLTSETWKLIRERKN